MKRLFNVALVGAGGMIGGQVLEYLEEREFPVEELRCLATGNGIGGIVGFREKAVTVQELTQNSFGGIDIAFFCADSDTAREFCPAAVSAGAVCIDTSSAWRLDSEVPLVVPGVNSQRIGEFRHKGIIATPASSVMLLATVLKPIHDRTPIRRIVISTYQAVSGTGRKAIKELQGQIGELLNGRPARPSVYSHQIAFNCLPQVDGFAADGSTVEELKLADETRKIIGADIRVSATAVRIPVFYGHAAAVNLETADRITVDEAREVLSGAPGVELVDNPAEGEYPTAVDAVGQDLVLVGRVREDRSIEYGLNLWAVADNFRCGGGTAAVRIAELLIASYLDK